MKFPLLRTVVAAALPSLFSTAALACASCGCSLSSDWESQGLVAEPGWRVDLRYDYINQSQLRGGSGTVNRNDYPFPAAREMEQVTTNRYLTLGIDYSPNKDWGFNLQIPKVERFHQTVAPGDVDLSESSTDGLGDVRFTARYQGFNETHNIGVMVGVKLPTGDYQQNFQDGVQAGNPLDRGLQAGTGSTDLILGVFRSDALSRDWDWFAKATWQGTIATKDSYHPGNTVNLGLGTRYLGFDLVTPELQINVQHKSKDSGLNADAGNSGGTLVYLSPGVTLSVDKRTKLYGYVQLPVYQYVEGFQLAPRWTATAGVRFAF